MDGVIGAISGREICMGMVCTSMRMGRIIKANFPTKKRAGSVNTPGRVAGFTGATGWTVR